MRRIVVLVVFCLALMVPGVAAAISPAARLLIREAGPSTIVYRCHQHNAGVLCSYSTPVANVGIGTEAPARWYGYAAVERGHVRFDGMTR